MLSRAPILDGRVVVPPGVGLDCAVVDVGSTLLVLKTDPITFTSEAIGWYAVQVNANDIATTGALPRWFLMTLLLPQADTSEELVEQISTQVFEACRAMEISVIGGHTEITAGLNRPILVGTMIGEVKREDLVTPAGALPGDRLLLTKGVPIEATAILAREFPNRLQSWLTLEELSQARDFIFEPGISVLSEARLALGAGKVTAMHDPTEGGLAAALWELAEASQCSLVVDLETAPIFPLSRQVCQAFSIDPLASIASGALLITVPEGDVSAVCQAIRSGGISCTQIGEVQAGPVAVWRVRSGAKELLARPDRDAIARLFEYGSLPRGA
jgi:hydrogenase maturation factor